MLGVVSVHLFRQNATLAQAGLKIPILLSQPSKCWKPRSVLCARSLRRFAAPHRLAHGQISREKADAYDCSQAGLCSGRPNQCPGGASLINNLRIIFCVFYICEKQYRGIRHLRNSGVEGITQA